MFVVDLFPRDGDPPVSLEDAILRKNDLTFACQTWQRLEAYAREQRLEARLATAVPAVLHLSYRPDAGDAISDKTYDYSPRTLQRRWQAGEAYG